jgi:hypothetical protein
MEEAGETFPTQLPSCHPTPLTMPIFSEAESLPRAVLALAMAAVHGELLGTDPPLVVVELGADEVRLVVDVVVVGATVDVVERIDVDDEEEEDDDDAAPGMHW